MLILCIPSTPGYFGLGQFWPADSGQAAEVALKNQIQGTIVAHQEPTT